MEPRETVTNFLRRMLTSSRVLRLDWLVAILFLLHVGSAHGQSIGSVSARQEGETIVISVPELTDLEVEELTYFYSMDSGKNWNEIANGCLEFEGEIARWAVLDCMNTDAFEGSAVQFKVDFSSCRPILFDGYEYEVVQIGDQCWFAENLRTSVYANGDAIRGNLSDGEWLETNSGAQSIYVNSKANLEAYGRLYNWHAVNDSRGLCPSGWHVPSDFEWMTLETELGMNSREADSKTYRGTDQGGQLKSSSMNLPSWNGSNRSGFSGLPGGFRNYDGYFSSAGKVGYWWSSSLKASYAWYRSLNSDFGSIYRNRYYLRSGFSVRCVRD